MKLLNKIYISPSILILIFMGIFLKIINELLFLFLICFIHELGHVLMSLIFHCKIKKITISIFGFSADIENIEYHPFFQQLFIYLAGPITFFVSFLLLFILKERGVINLYEYQVYMKNNLTLALFNLIPLYPLDGGRIVDIVYKKFFPVKESIKFRKLWSGISLIPVTLILVKEKQFFLFILIVVFALINLLLSKNEYIAYLKTRIFKENHFPKKYSFKNEIFHFSNNYYLFDNQVMTEKDIIPTLIVKEEITKKKRRKSF